MIDVVLTVRTFASDTDTHPIMTLTKMMTLTKYAPSDTDPIMTLTKMMTLTK
jgi:hypothetical protein